MHEELRRIHHDQSRTGLCDGGEREGWGILRNVIGKAGWTVKGLLESLYSILRLVGSSACGIVVF